MKVSPMLLSLLLAGCAASPPVAPGLIIAFGDSYTEGHGARQDASYPARLGVMTGRAVLNKGITGETAGEGARRLERDVIRNNPDLVIVEFGVNEAFRGHTVKKAVEDIDSIVERIQAVTDAKVIVVGVHFWSFREDFDAGLQDIAQRRGTGLVLDVRDDIVSSERDADDGDARLRSDAFHPNAEGYAIMADRIATEATRLLASKEVGEDTGSVASRR